MGRAARLVGRLILSAIASLVDAFPHVGHREMGLQPPDVVADLDHTHREEANHQVAVGSAAIEVAPPPAVPFVPAPTFPYPALFAHYNAYRLHPADYMQSRCDAAAIWAAVEHEKQVRAVAA